MAIHRYWRVVAMETHGADGLELSCFHLIDASDARLDASATLTASIAPATGALANLQDDDLATAARWPAQSIATLVLGWDLGGSPADVAYARLAGNSATRFLMVYSLQYSDDASTWMEQVVHPGISWPGVAIKTGVYTTTGKWSRTDKASTGSVNEGGDELSVWAQTSGRAIVSKSSGIVQFEITILVKPGELTVGVMTPAANLAGFVGQYAGGFSYRGNGSKYLSGSSSSYGAAYAVGDVIGVVVDFGTGSLTFYKNGVSQGVASATGMLGLTVHPAFGDMVGGAPISTAHLRGEDFAYPVAGASAWLGQKSPVLNKLSRTVTSDVVAITTGSPTIYGEVKIYDPVRLAVDRGEIPDYVTGVLGKGRGRVAGTVKETGTPNVPVYRKVRLVRERDGMVVRELWSHPDTGNYSFDYIDELQTWTVMAYDHTGLFRAVAQSGLTLADGGVVMIP